MLSDVEGFGIVLGTFGALIGGLALLRHSRPVSPEIQRKALHIGMGIVALVLPSLFSSTWLVMLLTGVLLTVLMGIKLVQPLRQVLGGVIYDVGRNSWGEIYFALGVCTLFAMAHREPLFYSISLFVLVLADPAASLIGGRFGSLHYEILAGKKTLEGSLAFLIVVLLVVEISLSVFSLLEPIHSLLIALVLAPLVTLVEAVACIGADNLFVPLGTFVLLKGLLVLNLSGLVVSFAIVATLVPIVFLLLYYRSNAEREARRQSLATTAIDLALGAVLGLARTPVTNSRP